MNLLLSLFYLTLAGFMGLATLMGIMVALLFLVTMISSWRDPQWTHRDQFWFIVITFLSIGWFYTIITLGVHWTIALLNHLR